MDISSAVGATPFEAVQSISTMALQAVSQGVVICDAERKVVWCNDAFTSITGYSLLDLAGRTCSVLQGHLTDPMALKAIGHALESHSNFHSELQNYRKNGEVYWNELSISPVHDSNGRVSWFIGINRDITARKESQQRLQESQHALVMAQQHSQAVLDNMMDGVITTDSEGRVEIFNKAASNIFGYSLEEVLGRSIEILMSEPHRSQHSGYVQHYHKTAEKRIIGKPRDLKGQHRDGRLFPLNLCVTRIERFGEPAFVGLVRDTTKQQQDEEEIRRLAFYDQLTSLPNRRLMMDRIRQSTLNSLRSGQHASLMLLDLDNFKLLNDTLGHEVGDELLRETANRISSCIREGDSVARFGGDEFIVLLEALSPIEPEAAAQAEMVALKIKEKIAEPFTLRPQPYSITASMGSVVYMQDHANAEDLIKKADVGMYQAKTAGRNSMRFFDSAMQSSAQARITMDRDMRNGLMRGEFLLHYQIQVDRHGSPYGAEALIRWNHPVRGMVSPAQFIPLAEETGFILALGKWVLEVGCIQLHHWALDPRFAKLSLALNVSALQIANDDFVASVEGALQASGADPQRLKLELTESLLAKDIEGTILKMNAIKALGVGFSLDDFGTGYSSLSYLKKLPMDYLKIDQSFVRELERDQGDAVIARTVVALGHSMGMQVIAEGVETKRQFDILVEYGCDAFQGYLFGRTMAASDLETELRPAISKLFAKDEFKK